MKKAMAATCELARFPETIDAGQTYTRVDGLYAVHGRGHGANSDGAEFVLDDGDIAVYRGERTGDSSISPVYGRGEQAPSVPTGRVYLRFAAGVSAESHRADIETADFIIESIPGYAPHTAWVRHGSGDIAESLRTVGRLKLIPGLESAEPQMLLPAVHKSHME